ncbi:hypothetical protein [Streptomyces sp. NPDC029004]|uniref:hypothetical protein n=1 Tax=Streptomyces sp. NPDC029004 TaxID=3154490 RepID=UPI0033C4536D
MTLSFALAGMAFVLVIGMAMVGLAVCRRPPSSTTGTSAPSDDGASVPATTTVTA